MLSSSHHQSTQVWYADDDSAIGNLSPIRSWFDSLLILGPKFGYFPEPQKSCLVIQESILPQAHQLFNDLDIKITTSSRFLGGVVGDSSGFRLPTELAAFSYSTSRSATHVLTDAIKFNTPFTPYYHICQVHLSRRDHSNVMREADKSTFSNIFKDAICLRYSKLLLKLPPNCDACSSEFTTSHALDSLISDNSARGIWQSQATAVFDVRVTDSDSPSYRHMSPKAVLKSAETAKRKKYSSASYCIMHDAGDEHIVYPPPPPAGDGRPPPPPPPPSPLPPPPTALPILVPIAGATPHPLDGGLPVLPPGMAPVLHSAPGLPLLQQQRLQIIAQLRAVNRQIDFKIFQQSPDP
uniref:Uncharacterized protein n=1 Tax=Amphimedon queenslandica TaxID=400682 RepID=A0A1X7TXC3_AMPQE